MATKVSKASTKAAPAKAEPVTKITKTKPVAKAAPVPVPAKSNEKVLSISLRPNSLDGIIGQDDIVSSIKAQFKSKRIPHFFLIVGPTGSGKTTLARIIALMLQQSDPLDPENDYNVRLSKYDIKEINASDKNGVDDVREILELIEYKPHQPSLAKVFILDEAHQYTTPAQNAWLKDAEDTPEHVYFIFCTSNDSKILPALKRRAHIINTHGIGQKGISKLLQVAKEKTGFEGPTEEFEKALLENEITTPGLILQATEKFFSGMDPMEAIYGTSEMSVDTKALCQAISKGDWKTASPILKTVSKEDIVMIRNCVLGYFKAILFNSGSVKIAQAMKIISEECYDVPTFVANMCIACNAIKAMNA
jgi:DNA polymerase III delta prime subunit